jgi:hypothetical protein
MSPVQDSQVDWEGAAKVKKQLDVGLVGRADLCHNAPAGCMKRKTPYWWIYSLRNCQGLVAEVRSHQPNVNQFCVGIGVGSVETHDVGELLATSEARKSRKVRFFLGRVHWIIEQLM